MWLIPDSSDFYGQPSVVKGPPHLVHSCASVGGEQLPGNFHRMGRWGLIVPAAMLNYCVLFGNPASYSGVLHTLRRHRLTNPGSLQTFVTLNLGTGIIIVPILCVRKRN
jgi:hypothetical protein